MAVTDVESAEKLSKQEFIDRLKAIHEKWSVMQTQFMKDFVSGRVPPEGLKGFAVSHWYLCDRGAYGEIEEVWTFRNESDQILRSTAENVVGEIGFLPDSLAPHPALAKSLCYALGMSDEEIEDTEVIPEMHAFTENGTRNRGVDDFNQGTMRGAYGIVEVDSALSSRAIGVALQEHYGLDARAAEYFVAHGYRDTDHGATNLETTWEMASTRDQQEEALAIAERAMRSRHELYRAYRSYYGDPG